MTKSAKYASVMATVVMLFATVSLYADPSFDVVNWDAGGDVLGWVSSGPSVMNSPASGGQGNSGFLNMHFDAIGPPAIETDTMEHTGADYTGNYAQYSDLSVAFSFLGYASSAQSLYFESTFGGASTWSYDFSSTAHAWEAQSISLSNPGGWTQLTGSEIFSDALSVVSLMGVTVQHLNAGSAFDYGMDDWQFMSAQIPEPGSVAMIITVMLSMLGSLRRRKRSPKDS